MLPQLRPSSPDLPGLDGLNLQRNRAIDGLRAAAILLVIGRHMSVAPEQHPLYGLSKTWQRGGWVGVDLFFVLSGFLVSGLLFEEFKRHGSLRPIHFLSRRALKIYPAFWAMIAVTSCMTAILGTFTWSKLAHELLFIQNYFAGLCSYTWTLAIEEQFYVLLVLILLALSRQRRPFSSLTRVCGAVLVAAWTWRCWLAVREPFSMYTHVFPTHLRLDSLMFGVLLSSIYSTQQTWLLAWAQRWRIALTCLGLLAFTPAFLIPLEESRFLITFGFSLLYLGSGCLLLVALSLPTPANRVLAGVGSLVAGIGSYSYSLYLWHLPVIVWLIPILLGPAAAERDYNTYLATVLVVVLGAGAFLAELVEVPILTLRDRWLPSRARPQN